VGSPGTGKSHLAVALAVAACRQRKRVRFTTAAELVTERIEAQSQRQLTRVRNRWMRYELVVLDELGYVVMPDAAAELLFPVLPAGLHDLDRAGWLMSVFPGEGRTDDSERVARDSSRYAKGVSTLPGLAECAPGSSPADFQAVVGIGSESSAATRGWTPRPGFVSGVRQAQADGGTGERGHPCSPGISSPSTRGQPAR
jgi:hypothetical protein